LLPNSLLVFLYCCHPKPINAGGGEFKPAGQHLHPDGKGLAKQLAISGISLFSGGKSMHISPA
jgi:hypothetical protein